MVLHYFEVTFHQCSSELVSGVVSTALSSGTVKCPTDDFQLDTPVRITIEHSDTVKVGHFCCRCYYCCGIRNGWKVTTLQKYNVFSWIF